MANVDNKHLVLRRNTSCFVKKKQKTSDSTDIIKMLEILINMHIMFAGRFFQQTVNISMKPTVFLFSPI